MKTVLFSLLIALFPSWPLLAEPTLKEVVEQNLATIAKPKAGKQAGDPRTPEMAGFIKELFLQHPIAHVVVHGLSAKGAKTTEDIYIHGEEIYVIQSDEGWNLAATEAGVFEWEKGKKNGLRIKRNNEDLFSYVLYLTDPAGLMNGCYLRYQSSPDDFTVIPDKEKGWTELRLKKPAEGFEAIYISEKPLWLRGLRMKNPMTGQVGELTVSAPAELEALPAELSSELKGMKFQDSDLQLKRHLVWL